MTMETLLSCIAEGFECVSQIPVCRDTCWQENSEAAYVLTYEECRHVIDQMRFGNESDLFGREKDDSFKGSIGRWP